MPSLKRKEHSSDEEDAPTTPLRATAYDARRSLSPTPSPKRRRCDVLESGMSQLTLDGRPIPPSSVHFAPGQFAPTPAPAPQPNEGAPTIYFPDASATTAAAPLWADGPHVPNVTTLPTTTATAVVRPGSVEEPTSPDLGAGDADVPEVSMKVPSWYEVEKDRIVITDLEDSDAEDDAAAAAATTGTKNASAAADDGAPRFAISSALLERLPKPHTFGPLAPEATPNNALVLYRPLTLPAGPQQEEEEDNAQEDDGPRIEEIKEDASGMEERMEEVPMDDPIEFSPIVESVGEPADEPMDIEML